MEWLGTWDGWRPCLFQPLGCSVVVVVVVVPRLVATTTQTPTTTKLSTTTTTMSFPILASTLFAWMAGRADEDIAFVNYYYEYDNQ